MFRKKRKILYICFDHQKPTGGQKQMYRHVDILNANGFNAYIMHKNKNFRLKWFENNTKIIDSEKAFSMFDDKKNFIVFPENLNPQFIKFQGSKIIFNQNMFYTYNSLKQNALTYFSEFSDIKYILTVSDHNAEYLNYIWPDKKVRRVYNGIKHNIFKYKDLKAKKNIISFLPKKSIFDLRFLYNGLQIRSNQNLNFIKQYEWKPIHNIKESEVAGILSESRIFLFPNTYEGLSLLPLEAMLSGTLVIAFKGGSNLEYLNDSNSFLIEPYNHLHFIKTIEEIISSFQDKTKIKKLELITKNALNTARAYSLKKETESVINFWEEAFES